MIKISSIIQNYNLPWWGVAFLFIADIIYKYITNRNNDKRNEVTQKSLEDVNHKLGIKSHYSEYKFDLEINIYKKLFEKMIDAEDSSDFLMKQLDIQPKEHKELVKFMQERDKWFCNKFNAFTRVVRQNKPFYKTEFYNQADSIIKTMIKLHNMFHDMYFSPNLKKYAELQLRKNDNEIYHKQIHSKINKLSNDVKKYLNNLAKD